MILEPPHITIQGIMQKSDFLGVPIVLCKPHTMPISEVANIKHSNIIPNLFYVVVNNGSYILNATGTQNKRYLYYQITQHEYIEIAKALFPDRIRKPIPAYDELPLSVSKINNTILSIEIEEEIKTKPHQLMRIT